MQKFKQENPYQNLNDFFEEMEISILKIIWTLKGPLIVKTILKEKNKVGVLTLPDIKTYYKAMVLA